MRPSEFEAIRPNLQRAVDDLGYFLNGEKEREKAKRELFELHDLMVADKTPPEVKGRGKHRPTKTQYMALLYGTKLRRRKRPDEPLDERRGKPLTDEEREAILADWDPGEPLTDAGWAALQFALRGGWQESSRQAAVWLRNAGQTVEADGIDAALSRLADEPREATGLAGYREAMHTAAGHVRTILTTCLEERPPAGKPPEAAGEGGESANNTVAAKKSKRSTERGEGRAKLIAALTEHHKYADGGCLNLEPIGNNKLAKLAHVANSTASAFYRDEFEGHTKYRALCGDATRLVAALKLLNQEFSPHHLFGGEPPGEGQGSNE